MSTPSPLITESVTQRCGCEITLQELPSGIDSARATYEGYTCRECADPARFARWWNASFREPGVRLYCLCGCRARVEWSDVLESERRYGRGQVFAPGCAERTVRRAA